MFLSEMLLLLAHFECSKLQPCLLSVVGTWFVAFVEQLCWWW